MAHDVSIVLHFLDKRPAWVSAQGASYLRPNCAANIRPSRLDPRKVREVTLVGTSKMVAFDDLDATEPVCQHFLEGVTRRREVLSDGNDGLRVVEILAGINASIARSGQPVPPTLERAA